MKAAIAAWWKRLWCRHEWRPVYHSYECRRCGKFDREF